MVILFERGWNEVNEVENEVNEDDNEVNEVENLIYHVVYSQW